jgi:phospholipid/cholesterol/gamma-HCH transport system permease protein
VIRQLYRVYVGALPLGAITGAALGVVIWMHIHGVLVRLGPGYTELLPLFLTLAVVLELAPLAAGMVIAGRTGASLGAELGSMRLTEQIDALQMMGQSPNSYLVGPRVLACIMALPLLTVLIAAVAVLTGYVAENVGGTLGWSEYWNASIRELRLRDVVPAVLKTAVFGFVIGAAGCHAGLSATGGTEEVGQAATRGVVRSMLLVAVSDVLMVRLIQLAG